MKKKKGVTAEQQLSLATSALETVARLTGCKAARAFITVNSPLYAIVPAKKGSCWFIYVLWSVPGKEALKRRQIHKAEQQKVGTSHIKSVAVDEKKKRLVVNVITIHKEPKSSHGYAVEVPLRRLAAK